jgi:hypothetical protein
LPPSAPAEHQPGTILAPAEDVNVSAVEVPTKQYFPGVDARLLSRVRDDTIFRKQDYESWFNLLRVLRDSSPEQIRAAATDGCVVNGAAYGSGFGLCIGDADPVDAPDAESLGRLLLRWLTELTTACGARSATSAMAVQVNGGAR